MSADGCGLFCCAKKGEVFDSLFWPLGGAIAHSLLTKHVKKCMVLEGNVSLSRFLD